MCERTKLLGMYRMWRGAVGGEGPNGMCCACREVWWRWRAVRKGDVSGTALLSLGRHLRPHLPPHPHLRVIPHVVVIIRALVTREDLRLQLCHNRIDTDQNRLPQPAQTFHTPRQLSIPGVVRGLG